MTDAIQAAGWTWKGVVVWHKPSARSLLGSLWRDTEFVLHSARGQPGAHTRQCFPGVFKHSVNPAEKVHLTGKSVELVKDLLAVTPSGAHVLDPFLGRGTTALACLETGRHFTGVELSGEYAALATERIRQAEAALK